MSKIGPRIEFGVGAIFFIVVFCMKSPIVKRSIVVRGHKTSVSL